MKNRLRSSLFLIILVLSFTVPCFAGDVDMPTGSPCVPGDVDMPTGCTSLSQTTQPDTPDDSYSYAAAIVAAILRQL